MMILSGFLRIEGGGQSNAPRPTSGEWEREEGFGPEDVRPNEPTIFMANTPAATATASK